MKIFKSLSEIQNTIGEDSTDCVVVIGNFDGVHKGHQALIKQGSEIADSLGKKLAVLTFEPHPRRLFRPDDPPNRITPPALKAERLAHHGVQILYSLEFNWDFASQGADDFINIILKQTLKAAHIVVGDDFYFGQMRKGTPKMIGEAGLQISIVRQVVDAHDNAISSSAIRHDLRHGDIKRANAALGWEWEIRGTIVKGDQRGRELGYPTANVPIHDTVHPAYGVYATWARIESEGIWRPSATNIGIRPMFKIEQAQVETFIFDFDREIYGETLYVKPVQRLRSEAKFDSLETLIEQMKKDCDQAQQILGV